MRKTRITAFAAGSMLIAAVLVAAATPALAHGRGSDRGVIIYGKTRPGIGAIGDPSIKLRTKNFRNPRAFNPQPDPPGKRRASNPPDGDKTKTSNPPDGDKHKTHRRR